MNTPFLFIFRTSQFAGSRQYPAAIILIGSWPYGDPNYHTPEDTPERSDVPNATKQVQAALAAVLTLDQER